MAIRLRVLLLICVLYCAVIIQGILLNINDSEICNVLCKECNASTVFMSDQCECKFNDNNNEGIKCIQDLKKDIQTIYLDIFSNGLVKRTVRSALKPRRRLRIGDAEKVAQYFMNGGVSAGHSHFIKGSNGARDIANSATNSLSDRTQQSDTENRFNLPLPTGPFAGNTYKSYAPDIPGAKAYAPVLGTARPNFGYPMYPPAPALNSIVYPYRHRPLPHILSPISALPSYIFHDLAAHHYSLYYHPMHHNFIDRNNLRQENSATIPFVGRPYGNNHDSNYQGSNNSATTGNNADESVRGNVTSSSAGMNVLYPPVQHVLPYRYVSYSPLLNALYFPFNQHIVQAVPQYLQRASDSTPTSVQNPNSSSIDNTNTERRDEVSTNVTDEIAHSNDDKQAEKTDDTTKNQD